MKHFKNIIFFTILFCLATSAAFGQKRNIPAKKPAAAKSAATAPKSAATPVLTEIPAAEWSAITAALAKEDWAQAALLSSAALGKVKIENEKRQIAQLRYFYLFALAGKAAEGKTTYAELEKIADSFIGKEFLMPSRQFLADCTKKVNYICAAKDDENTLRVTATNKSGSAIHSFEYVKLDEKANVEANDGKSAFVGGTLEQTEINKYKQNISILRLIFDKGFVNIVASR